MKIPRNVTLDTNILIEYVTSKKDGSLVKRVICKSKTEDRIMLTDVIVEECRNYSKKPKARATVEQIMEMLEGISKNIINAQADTGG